MRKIKTKETNERDCAKFAGRTWNSIEFQRMSDKNVGRMFGHWQCQMFPSKCVPEQKSLMRYFEHLCCGTVLLLPYWEFMHRTITTALAIYHRTIAVLPFRIASYARCFSLTPLGFRVHILSRAQGHQYLNGGSMLGKCIGQLVVRCDPLGST